MQLRTADTYLFGKFLHIEIRIGKILIDTFHNPIHQIVVIALHLYLFHFLFLFLCA